MFRVSVGGQSKTMSAKEVALRQILKKAIEKKDFKSMAYLLGLFEKHGWGATPQRSNVVWLPTNSMPFRMAKLILYKYGLPRTGPSDKSPGAASSTKRR